MDPARKFTTTTCLVGGMLELSLIRVHLTLVNSGILYLRSTTGEKGYYKWKFDFLCVTLFAIAFLVINFSNTKLALRRVIFDPSSSSSSSGISRLNTLVHCLRLVFLYNFLSATILTNWWTQYFCFTVNPSFRISFRFSSSTNNFLTQIYSSCPIFFYLNF